MTYTIESRRWSPPRSAFAGSRFPPAAIVVAVRWYLRYALSYRDVEELLVERGIAVDHVTVSPGSTIHTAAGRRRPVHPPRTGRSLVDIREVGEDF